jgi:hypothetical protein
LEPREWHVWIYDARTPDVVAATKLASIELSFGIDGSHRDSLQNPARFESIREAMARASITRALAPTRPNS